MRSMSVDLSKQFKQGIVVTMHIADRINGMRRLFLTSAGIERFLNHIAIL